MAAACQEAGCALLGGETAEMPGVYEKGEVDVVGTIIGVVDRRYLIDGKDIRSGDVVLGLASSGLHTNGYSLARYVLRDENWTTPHPDLNGKSIGDVLLAVHRSYLKPIQTLQQNDVMLKGLAHITGGGIIDNLPRILPAGLGADIRRGTWPVPPIFQLIERMGNVVEPEMHRTLNMGIGMLLVVAPDDVGRVRSLLQEDVYQIGAITDTHEGVVLR
jgi:phosphoribosylformylglycinamidine cyclo-ligase